MHTPVSIGPFATFSGRLIVIEPTRRWQVALTWQAEKPELGQLRITHAATATVVELRWQGQQMQVRDNQQPGWRHIGPEQLSEHGIVIPPQQLAAILLGQMPVHFRAKKPGNWESTAHGHLIRLRWQQSANKLTMTDIKHGRKATLIIQP
ncbi:MAG: lipoprotein insertase outer membrane protein LolB [Mariprofundus sp.]